MRSVFLCLLIFTNTDNIYCQHLGNYDHYEKKPHQLIFISTTGERLSLKAYTNAVIRIQAVRNGEQFFPNHHYEMVASHSMSGQFRIKDDGSFFTVSAGAGILKLKVFKQPLKLEFIYNSTLLLKEQTSIQWDHNEIAVTFKSDTAEHFCGLGHQAYGLVPSLDLKGKMARTNYGNYDYNTDADDWLAQAFLIVPFYLSGKGYGIFLNSTFPNNFSFNNHNNYSFRIDTKSFEGRMDYFFIPGPSFKTILEQYTQITGRPRLPQRSIFGLQLSDKDTPLNEGEGWWKNTIDAHRAAGYPLDHIVNDNRWRAGTGAWSGSWFEWDKTRYPDPAAYKRWVDSNGLTMTLDHNRNNGAASWGWKPSFNIPNSNCVKENYAVPDYSGEEVRNWIWSLFWNKSFDPSLHYPGDAIWMDETDELQCIPDTVITANKRSWAENRNYYPFLVAKA
ncbi:MAG TPA: TIM-barrel domain-containing protein, partial [Ferruginibacter sp.]|nr:TIM-barrel domain-containing protein [Ferruginibacter sp.]